MRKKIVCLRFSEEEKLLLDEASKKEFMTTSSFVRKIILKEMLKNE